MLYYVYGKTALAAAAPPHSPLRSSQRSPTPRRAGTRKRGWGGEGDGKEKGRVNEGKGGKEKAGKQGRGREGDSVAPIFSSYFRQRAYVRMGPTKLGTASTIRIQAVREATTICPAPCKLTFDLLTF